MRYFVFANNAVINVVNPLIHDVFLTVQQAIKPAVLMVDKSLTKAVSHKVCTCVQVFIFYSTFIDFGSRSSFQKVKKKDVLNSQSNFSQPGKLCLFVAYYRSLINL